jgi:hypothetical protein
MADGCGIRLWCDPLTRAFVEETRFRGEGERGYRRHWAGDERTLHEEIWGPGKGSISRRWIAPGKLRRGFPWYFLDGRQVTKRAYLQACRNDPALPAYRPEDDEPHRELPAEYLAQNGKR